MKKKVLAAILIAVGVLTGCGNTEPISSPIQTVEAEPIATDIQEVEQSGATEEANENHDGMYRSELTNEWIDESLKDQRPIAVMVDNEKTALPHFGVADADVVYEIMNSTLNDRITRFMVVVKDWDKIEQLGSIRSARPTNFMLAAEWNAVLCHSQIDVDMMCFYIAGAPARFHLTDCNTGYLHLHQWFILLDQLFYRCLQKYFSASDLCLTQSRF